MRIFMRGHQSLDCKTNRCEAVLGAIESFINKNQLFTKGFSASTRYLPRMEYLQY